MKVFQRDLPTSYEEMLWPLTPKKNAPKFRLRKKRKEFEKLRPGFKLCKKRGTLASTSRKRPR